MFVNVGEEIKQIESFLQIQIMMVAERKFGGRKTRIQGAFRRKSLAEKTICEVTAEY